MEPSADSLEEVIANSREFARRLLTIGENRLELLMVEVAEERERLFHAFLLALGVAAFGLLGGITLTAAIVVCFWDYSPLAVLLTLSVLYVGAGVLLFQRLSRLLRHGHTLSASLNQLRKDRECLKKLLA